MRALWPLSLPFALASGLACALACGGVGVPEAPPPPLPPPVVEAPAPPPVWELTEDANQTLVKAGTAQSLEIDATVVLLGPPLAGTEHRQVVGSARVAEIWPDLARVEPLRIKRDAPAPVAARALTPEDGAVVEAIPLLEERKATRGARAAAQSDAATEGAVPFDLKSGTNDERIQALVRRERDADATYAIVWVMKNDPSEDVRFKAWRIVEARWKRGTGKPAEHRAAAVWQSTHGSKRARGEAADALAEQGK